MPDGKEKVIEHCSLLRRYKNVCNRHRDFESECPKGRKHFQTDRAEQKLAVGITNVTENLSV